MKRKAVIIRNNKYNNTFAAVIIAFGIVSLMGAAAWSARNLAEDFSAGQVSRKTAEKLEKIIEAASDTDCGEMSSGELVSSCTPELMEMPTFEINGAAYIGVLEIPSKMLFLPVCCDWNYDNLSISPCRYSGSYFTDDMVICAHDFGSHFRGIRSLNIGDTVFFTAKKRKKIKYIVTNIETVYPNEVEKMILNTKPDGSGHLWDMTLFTCNIGGGTRCAVRLERIKEPLNKSRPAD